MVGDFHCFSFILTPLPHGLGWSPHVCAALSRSSRWGLRDWVPVLEERSIDHFSEMYLIRVF